MLRLIFGPSGSGKSAKLLSYIREDIQNGVRSYLLVPEQQAYISERDLPSHLPSNAGLWFEVVNFSRLADDVFRAFGGLTSPSVSGGIRSLLMWNTLRALSPSMEQYGIGARGDTKLSELMLATVNELDSCGIDAEKLEDALEKVKRETPSSPLCKKLSDIAMVHAAYHLSLESAFGIDPGDQLLRMAQKLERHTFFEGAHIYIDSFTDFTVPEYAVLGALLRQADCVTVALCSDAPRSKLIHFEPSNRTAERLKKCAKERSVPIEECAPLTVDPTQKPAELQLLERELWNFTYQKPRPKEPVQKERKNGSPVTLLTASNIYEEAEAAAYQITEWVMDGMSYGDIAVVVRDTETYRGVLDAALERHGIPYFLSERTDLSSKSVSRLILSALRAVNHSSYRRSDIMTLLKTGLCGVELRDAAMFEEYCETWHIGGKRFFDTVWSMNPDGLVTKRSERADVILDAANRVRRILMEPLARLAADLKASNRLYDRCRALYDYLSAIELSQTLSLQARQELDLGSAREAGESIRLYRLILESLSTLCRLMPDEEMSVDEFISALSLLFSNSDLGSVPTVQDCVVIGSAATLRVENVRASILLGLCEGEFPAAVSDDGIFTEGDKETLEKFEIILDSRETLRSAKEMFYAYRAMTKPTEKLMLCTVAQLTDGSKRTPSLPFSRAAFLLDQRSELFDYAALREAEGLLDPTAMEPRLATPPVTEAVTLHLSQSKIQTFVLCPYRYYTTYTLGLREQKDSTPTYADDGTFLHYVFERFLSSALGEDGKLRLPAPEDTERIADEIIASYINEICPFSPEQMDNRLLHLYARLRKLSILMLEDILTEIRTGLFVPTKFEQAIGKPYKGGVPAFVITLKNGTSVTLTGTIDRVDLYKTDGKTYVRVVDYKSGEHNFALKDVRSGLDIQLVLYLFAALAADKDLTAAGAQYLFAKREDGKTEIKRSGFYLNEEDVLRATNGDTQNFYTKSKKMLAQSAEEIADLKQQMTEAVSEIATRILSGEAQKTPSEAACKFCPVRTSCNRAYRK